MTDDTVKPTYPTDAACAGAPDPTLWDAAVYGESAEHKEWRHHRARTICRGCPVAFECAQDWQKGRDEGIRAANDLPPIHPRPEREAQKRHRSELARLVEEGVNEATAAILAAPEMRRRRGLKKAS